MITAPAEIYSCLIDDEDLRELVEMFVAEIPERTAKLVEAMQSGDIAEVGRFAHQLKGAAGSYGFDGVTPIASRLEHAARSSGTEGEIEAALKELVDICGRLRAGEPPL